MEKAEPGAHHGDAQVVAGGDDVLFASGAAGLDYVVDAAGVGAIYVVPERNEGV